MHREKAMGGHRERLSASQGGLSRKQTCRHLDLGPPELQENKFVLFKPVSLWCFVSQLSQVNTWSHEKKKEKI